MAWTVAAPPVSELLDADAELEEEEDDDEEEEEEEAEAVEFPLELLLQVGWSGKSLIPTPLQSFWVNLMTSERRNELVCLREREREGLCLSYLLFGPLCTSPQDSRRHPSGTSCPRRHTWHQSPCSGQGYHQSRILSV